MAQEKRGPGRPPGSQNKSTKLGKDAIVQLLANYNESGMMAEDFLSLEPGERLKIAERLMQYVLPKQQATSIDINAVEGRKTIEDTLSALAGEDEE